MTVQPTRDQLRALADAATEGPWVRNGRNVIHTPIGSCIALTHRHDPEQRQADAEFIAASRQAVPALLDMLDQAERRIRDLTQEVRDERAACLDQIEQVQARDARIKAVEDVLEEPDAMIGAHTHVSVTRIRRALDGER